MAKKVNSKEKNIKNLKKGKLIEKSSQQQITHYSHVFEEKSLKQGEVKLWNLY